MKLRTLSKTVVRPGLRVLMRIDSDIPLKNGRIVKGSTLRLERAIPDIKDLSARGAVIILLGHLGRPEGKKVANFSLAPISKWLEKDAGIKNKFVSEVVGEKVEKAVSAAEPGSVIMLENVRFNDRETKDCKKFAKKLARFSDIYVNNAFGTCHRKQTSVHRITEVLPSYAGSVLVEEVDELSKKFGKPLTLLVGGAKLETKLPIIKKMIENAQAVLLGGGLALVFHAAATGVKLKMGGKKIAEKEIKLAATLIKKYDNIILPIDYIDSKQGSVHAADVSGSSDLIDIGTKTRKQFAEHLEKSKTVIFNGTMGVVEMAGGAQGTLFVSKKLAICKAHSIVGGGDTVGFLEKQGLINKFDFVSAAGGAMLAFLAGEKLPGLEVLRK